jgi:hypothetical protein
LIPGSRARDYLRERDPGFDWPKGGLTEGSRAWRLLFLLFAVVALGIVVVTLALPSTANSRDEAVHLGFGYPLSFVWVDETALWNPPGYPQTYLFNPWEDPSSHGNGWRFIADWLLVTAALWTPIWLLRRGLTSWRTSTSPD